jgi:hypothetical protein
MGRIGLRMAIKTPGICIGPPQDLLTDTIPTANPTALMARGQHPRQRFAINHRRPSRSAETWTRQQPDANTASPEPETYTKTHSASQGTLHEEEAEAPEQPSLETGSQDTGKGTGTPTLPPGLANQARVRSREEGATQSIKLEASREVTSSAQTQPGYAP